MTAALSTFLPLALEGDWGDVRGILVVAAGFLILVGSIYMLLASNFGMRQGYLIMMVALSAFIIFMSLVWLVGAPGTAPGTGPRAGKPSDKILVATEPHWVPFLPESEQGREFRDVIARFPDGWDQPGTVYPGKIDSKGEFDSVKTLIQESLALLAEEKALEATDKDDWAFRLPGSEALTPQEKEIPEAIAVRYYQEGTPLLFGVTIPASDDHAEITVFAFRDKGRVFLYSLYFLIVSILSFAFHLWLLARYERKEKAREAATAEAPLS